jgi:hypothetical protein
VTRKVKAFAAAAAAALVVLALATCASKPAPVEQPAPTPQPSVQPAPQPAAQPAPAPAATVAAPDAELRQARASRDRVLRFKLDQQSPQEFAAAEAKLKDGESQINKDNAAAKVSIEAAAAGYRKILQDGLAPLARKGRQDVETVRASAGELKAQVAMAADYSAAESVYQKSVASDSAGDQEAAIDGYAQSREMFVKVVNDTKVKKDRAERALLDARQGLADTEARAKAAEDAQKAEGAR